MRFYYVKPLPFIWQPLFDFTPMDIQACFLKHTAHEIKKFDRSK